MLALPKISLHGAGAIGDMVRLLANKRWGKALIVTDGQLVKLGLLDSLFTALDAHQMSYQLFDAVFPNPTEALVQKAQHTGTRNVIILSPSAAAARLIPPKRLKSSPPIRVRPPIIPASAR